MKKPKLNEYSDGILKALADQYQDKVFDEEIIAILEGRYLNNSYIELYILYKKENGVKKRAIANALASYLENDLYFMEEEVYDKLLLDVSIEHLWALGKSDNLERREKARELIYKLLDEIEESFKDEEITLLRRKSDARISEVKK